MKNQASSISLFISVFGTLAHQLFNTYAQSMVMIQTLAHDVQTYSQ